MGNKYKSIISRILVFTLLVLILIMGGYFRFAGIDWDEEQHLHPDERFLTMVESSLYPVSSIADYFDSGESTLNPANQGHSFYVYGTLPIFMVRYLAEWLEFTGYGSIYLVGRFLSAVMDLLTVVLVFFIGTRLYNRWVGLLGSTFSALAVLQIQQSHFFTVDTFITFFTLLAVYFAVEVVTAKGDRIDLISYIFFGVALGMAVASKVNAAPVALTLPLAAFIHWSQQPQDKKNDLAPKVLLYLVIAALFSLVTFRLAQPYAFKGPGFFNFALDENWVSGLKALRAQTSGDVDFPPALQWARRPLWFSLKNLVVWGLGIPYALMAWLGFCWMGWEIFIKKNWKSHLVIWAWFAFYFIWQSLQWNSTMRYQLPIYPLLAVFASWVLVEAWNRIGSDSIRINKWKLDNRILRSLLLLTGIVALILTAGWAYAFSQIYTKPQPRVAATRWILKNLPGPATLIIDGEEGEYQQLLTYPDGNIIQTESNWLTSFEAKLEGQLIAIEFPEILNQNPSINPLNLKIILYDQDGEILLDEQAKLSFNYGTAALQITPDPPIDIYQGKAYQLRVGVVDPAGAITLQGTGIANESSWDDGLPLRMDGYDPFGGIYQGGLNFELYWDDNPEKLGRFIDTMKQAEYIIISSSRQWATTTRVPERYPLTTEYYRRLMGCPIEHSIEDCYNRALPGTYQGDLGYDLIQTFQNNPTIGPIEINDQPAEEAFTVYDHPKVFIFEKSPNFDLGEVTEILSAVDLSKVIHITPKQADKHPGDLMLPADRLIRQRAGGTWSDLFNTDSIFNRYPFAGAVLWYITVFLLGLLVYPLMRYIFSGLKDRGYPLARTVGLLLLSYLSWLAGSTVIPFTRSTILGIILLVGTAGLLAGYLQREELIQEWHQNRKYYLMVEGLAIGLFIFAVLIRFGNPDLWHPWKGGEKPMDFSYFNAVIKSTSFPPYDPWFAGGYINYYYYGFVFVGVLVKLLGIQPSIAYNLILPTLFTFLGLGAFSLGWNLLSGDSDTVEKNPGAPLLSGGAGVLALVFFGNLGVLRMIFQGLQRLGSQGINVLDGNFFQRLKWTLLGFVQLFKSMTLHYRLDEWYWNPSRAIGAEHGGPITEFPFFTFLYGDLHAHFIALPLTLVVIAWILSVVFDDQKKKKNWAWDVIGIPVFGALAVGVLRPTNTWDFYPFLALALSALIYTTWKDLSHDRQGWLRLIIRIVIFFIFSTLLFKPYGDWYGQGYTNINPWFGTHTPVNDYLTHWGLFIFIVFSWMAYETIHWMANTPVSALNNLRKYRELIIAGLLIVLVIMVSLGVPLENKVNFGEYTLLGAGIHIIWFVLPLMVWAGILIFRPNMPLVKQVVLFLIGTALALSLMVEIVYVEGDIGRMNTVFKFYLQSWTLFAICSAASFSWLAVSIKQWKPTFQFSWQFIMYLLVTSAALYPMLGSVAKIKDRIALNAPHTLDGMAFMQTATYTDLDTVMDLSQDYDAIRWMQDNVLGSPVIVEANQVEYHWGTRYTVYTGLPGVVGWNWHQRQQRTLTPHDWVYSRVDDVNYFYDTADLGFARDFLKKYDVEYIVVGQLERAKYLPEGIAKFETANDVLWTIVYQDEDTNIYQTLDSEE